MARAVGEPAASTTTTVLRTTPAQANITPRRMRKMRMRRELHEAGGIGTLLIRGGLMGHCFQKNMQERGYSETRHTARSA
jgi:hypothetical protein